MTVRSILEYPDPRLREPSESVERFDAALAADVRDLLDTHRALGGIGLSAPQIGIPRRIVLLDPGDEDEGAEPEIFVNPELLEKRTLGFVEESCLSVPGVVGSVMRAVHVRVRARTVDGEPFERALSFLPACVLQHEMDHLDGRLFVDRFSVFGRLRVRMAFRARRRAAAGTPARARAP